jgi:hypothetical protein
MRFEYYHAGLDNVPKLSVDGTVDHSLHFSHWQGNETPRALKADTSTEIALNLVSSPSRDEFTQGIELVTNNHFDTDGVLSVWTVLTGERATDLSGFLIPAAEAGDFSEFRTEAGVKASIVIQGSDQPVPGEEGRSPIASHLSGGKAVDDAEAYDLVLPEVERILTRVNDYEHLWRDAWSRIAAALESFARGSSRVVEYPNAGLSLVTLAPDIFSPNGFNPTRHSAPFTAISHYAKGRLFVITTEFSDGWSYRVDYPYYSWAETVVRPRIERHDFSSVLNELNDAESQTRGKWRLDNAEMTSAIKFIDEQGQLASSKLPPDDVAKIFQKELTGQTASAAP